MPAAGIPRRAASESRTRPGAARAPMRRPVPDELAMDSIRSVAILQLWDSQFNKPFEQSVLVSINNVEFRTDRKGRLRNVKVLGDFKSNEILVRAPRSFTPEVTACVLKWRSQDGTAPGVLTAAGKLYSQVEVRPIFTGSIPHTLIVDVLSLPEPVLIAEEMQTGVFTMVPRQMLDAARQRLGDPSLPIETERFVFNPGDRPGEPLVFLSTLGGEVVITVAAEPEDGGVRHASSTVPAVIKTTIRRGASTEVEAPVRPRRSVFGRLTDESGRPLPQRKVTVAVKRVFARGEVLPRWDREPNSPAVALSSSLRDGSTTAILHRTVRTNEQGRFSVLMPIEGDQAAWAFVRGRYMAYQEAPGGPAPGEGLILVATKAEKKRLIKVVDEEGQPLGRLGLDVLFNSPPHPFQLNFPKFRTNAKGMLDAPWIPPEGTYCLFIDDRRFPVLREVSLARDILVLSRRSSSR